MSERKSWDIQPKRKATPPPAASPAALPPRSGRPVRTAPRPQPPARPSHPSARRAPLPAGTLRERRRRRRRLARYAFLAILLLLVVAALYVVWRPNFRIHTVTAHGPGADAAKQIALADASGTYLHLIPRNSIFFYPQKKIRAAILDALPEAAAVSLKRDSFTSIIVTTLPREGSFIWCGTGIDTPDPAGCYEADVQGFIFKQAPIDPLETSTTSSSSGTTTASSKGAHEQVRIFSSLDKELAPGQSPVRAHVASAQYLYNALKFVDAMRSLGAPVSALAIRGDEADLWLNGPTRITYVLGQEKQAADVAASALPTLNLTNASIQYVDLRFPGKAYVKKYGE